MKKKKTPKRSFKFNKLYLIVLIGFPVLISGISIFLSVKAKNDLQNSIGQTVALFGTFKTYTSHKLGISFIYASGPSNQVVQVKEIDHRVYLYVDYTKKNDPTTGKFVEVFSKDPNQSLTDAVKSAFLQGYSSTTCPVIPARLTNGTENPAREYDQITTPQLTASEYSVRRQLDDAAKCPATYTTSRLTGTSYFMMDPNHPDKFVYFKLGEDNILAAPWTGSGKPFTWDESLTFLGN